jgi:acetyl esterase/lipase
MKGWVLASLLAAGLVSAAHAQQLPAGIPPPIALWPHGAPGALGNSEADRPRLYALLPQKRSTSTAVLVIPGGGYQHLAIGYEGLQIAGWLNSQGIPAFLLDYRVAPYHFPGPIEDGEQALRLIHERAAEFGVDPNRIGVWGFSAGGHLASTLGTLCTGKGEEVGGATVECPRPAFLVLAYPVITMEKPLAHAGSRANLLGPNPDEALAHRLSNQFNVTADTPGTFLFATTRDPTVPVENSLDFYRALERAHVPAELHLYDYANHGCGLCGSIIPLASWPVLLRNWLVQRGWIPPDAPAPPPPQPNLPAWIEGLTGPGQFDGHW